MGKNSRIKGVFFDIDGTLIGFDGSVRPSVPKALEQLHEQGIKVFLATGRPELWVKDFLKILPFPYDGIVSMNGQKCVFEGKVIRTVCLSEEDVHLAMDYFLERDILTNIHTPDMSYITRVRDHERRMGVTLPPQDLNYSEIAQLTPMYVRPEDEKALNRILKHSRITRWGPDGVDIVPKESGKMTGIEAVLEAAGLSFEEVIAFGDSENDIDMLERCGIGIAMGNAPEKVKQKADRVCESIADDGIYKELMRIGLLQDHHEKSCME